MRGAPCDIDFNGGLRIKGRGAGPAIICTELDEEGALSPLESVLESELESEELARRERLGAKRGGFPCCAVPLEAL